MAHAACRKTIAKRATTAALMAWRMDVMLGASRPARGRLGAGPTVAQARTYLEDLSRYRGRRSGGESFGPAVKYVVYRVETGSSPPRQKLEPDLGRDGTHPATGGRDTHEVRRIHFAARSLESADRWHWTQRSTSVAPQHGRRSDVLGQWRDRPAWSIWRGAPYPPPTSSIRSGISLRVGGAPPLRSNPNRLSLPRARGRVELPEPWRQQELA